MANQKHTITAQLENGVRALMLDIWKQDGELVLRHGSGMARFLGVRPIAHGLNPVAEFLKRNPDAVVTLILESYVPVAELVEAFRKGGLDRYCHAHVAGEPWPTLGKMRESGKRLVVFCDRVKKDDGAPAWMMPVWDHCWETNWEARSTEGLLAAEARRGDQKNALFILNHFITKGGPSAESAKLANRNPFLKGRVESVTKRFERRPNFLVLDYYEIGDAAAVVAELNREPPVPEP